MAGGASPLDGIPGLTRTYALGEEPTFAELLGACAWLAVHVEIHDVHRTSDAAYQAWLAGRSDPQESAFDSVWQLAIPHHEYRI